MIRLSRILALLLAALAPAASARDDWKAPRIVTWNCSGCHSVDGNATLPDIPRLAGQNAAYLEKQIAAFAAAPAPSSIEWPAWFVKPAALPDNARGGALATRFMIGPAHTTDPADARAAAAWYAKRTPARGTPSADSALLAKGDALYARGDPATGVIACQDCHGRDGRGIGDMPALAGQHAAYLERQLRAFTDGTRPLGVTMHGIARGLSAEERSAVAAYAQSLPAGAAR